MARPHRIHRAMFAGADGSELLPYQLNLVVTRMTIDTIVIAGTEVQTGSIRATFECPQTCGAGWSARAQTSKKRMCVSNAGRRVGSRRPCALRESSPASDLTAAVWPMNREPGFALRAPYIPLPGLRVER